MTRNGAFGTWPSAGAKLLEEMGYEVHSVSNNVLYDTATQNGAIVMFTFLNNVTNLSQGAHSVVVEVNAGGKIDVYNLYGNSQTIQQYNSFADMMQQTNIVPMSFYYVMK